MYVIIKTYSNVTIVVALSTANAGVAAASTGLSIPSSYTYDPTSGYYYDSSTSLYYDPKTGVSLLLNKYFQTLLY